MEKFHFLCFLPSCLYEVYLDLICGHPWCTRGRLSYTRGCPSYIPSRPTTTINRQEVTIDPWGRLPIAFIRDRPSCTPGRPLYLKVLQCLHRTHNHPCGTSDCLCRTCGCLPGPHRSTLAHSGLVVAHISGRLGRRVFFSRHYWTFDTYKELLSQSQKVKPSTYF